MKSIKKIGLFVLVVNLVFAWSCKKDETVVKPSLNVSPTSATATAGQKVSIHITSTSSIKELKIEEDISGSSGKTTLFDSMPGGKTIDKYYSYPVPSGAATKTVTVTVWDNANVSNSQNVVITVTGGGTLVNCSNKTLGAQNNSTGSFFATSDCSIHVVANNDAKNNQSKIDFLFLYDNTSKATLASPSSAEANNIAVYGINTWTSPRTTTFKKAGSQADFVNATSSNIATGYTNAPGTADNKAPNLSPGMVYYFKTQDGRFGILQTNSVSQADNGTINFDAKVQQ